MYWHLFDFRGNVAVESECLLRLIPVLQLGLLTATSHHAAPPFPLPTVTTTHLPTYA